MGCSYFSSLSLSLSLFLSVSLCSRSHGLRRRSRIWQTHECCRPTYIYLRAFAAAAVAAAAAAAAAAAVAAAAAAVTSPDTGQTSDY